MLAKSLHPFSFFFKRKTPWDCNWLIFLVRIIHARKFIWIRHIIGFCSVLYQLLLIKLIWIWNKIEGIYKTLVPSSPTPLKFGLGPRKFSTQLETEILNISCAVSYFTLRIFSRLLELLSWGTQLVTVTKMPSFVSQIYLFD